MELDAAGRPYEIVVVDNASQDGTGDVVRDLFALGFHLPGDGSRAACFRAAADLSTLPAWNLHRPLRRDQLPGTVTAIVEQVAA